MRGTLPIYFPAVSLVPNTGPGTESISVLSGQRPHEQGGGWPREETFMASSKGLELAMMDAMKIGDRAGRFPEVVWDTSGNEYTNLSSKIENKITNRMVTLNSQFSARNS